MRDLAEYFRCDPSYVTSLVDGLESAGLAERRTHATDRRVKMVALSHSGVEAQAQVRKILDQPPPSFSALTTPSWSGSGRCLAGWTRRSGHPPPDVQRSRRSRPPPGAPSRHPLNVGTRVL